MNYKKLDLIVGWLTFAIAAIVYILTIEPTASFWDCGEFISTGYKLEVGHPPGAPFFMLLTKFFTLFAGGNLQKVAMMANIMSALASAFSILFLFWTITHLAKKLVKNTKELTNGQTIAILGSGFVGALAYTFSDTFWFSAVEGEVYATSSLFTAFVFWAILKWENIANEKYNERWIVLIAYILGLSIGVHLLNLLAIPTIVLVYYFKKYKATPKGLILSLILSAVILGFIMWGIIPGVVKTAFLFDKLFVNSFGLPFNSGLLFFVFLAAGLLAFSIYYTRKKGKAIMHLILVSFTFILIGYSSYGVILIRSNATPPIDQNNPEDAFSLLGYLNREQYGDRPLFMGQYYNSPINIQNPYKNTKKTWKQKDGKYVEGPEKISYRYNDKFITIFPRMYSPDPNHLEDYKNWARVKGIKVNATNNRGEMQTFVKPTFSENLRFFFRYQIGHMYFRYFMWNFAGRQNDVQGHGGPLKGNWLTGIDFFDQNILKLGPQDNVPSEYANNKAHNKYYLLPFILGLVGLIYHFNKDKKNFWVTMTLFILTGLAIVVYLNQTPQQPRERDYAYAGSFYAFAIWIGLGTFAIFDIIKKYLKQPSAAVLATILTLFIPILMAAQNWDDHDRSDRYIARDFAYNYLNSCEKNGILFTNGDNDTFPLWYIQEVEEVRTDVRVICLPYLTTNWYIDQMKSKYYDSEPIPFVLNHEQYSRDNMYQIPVFEDQRLKESVELKQIIDFVGSDDPRSQLTTNQGDKSNYFPTKRFKVTVDSAKVMANKVVKKQDTNLMVKEIKWNINTNYVIKNDLMILDLLSNNNWERPIYFVSPGAGNETNMRDYFQMEGFAARFVPIETKFDHNAPGRIDSEILYNNLMNKFRWGNMGKEKVYLDENIRRTIRVVKFRNTFGRLAKQLAKENKVDSAKKVIHRCLEILPFEKIPVNLFDNHFVEAFFEAGMEKEGRELILKIAENAQNDLIYLTNLEKNQGRKSEQDKQIAAYTLQWLNEVATSYKEEDLRKQMDTTLREMYMLFQ